MEQVKTQMNMADKIKRYTILPLMAMGVFMGGFSSNAHADPLEAAHMDAETLSKTLLGGQIIGTISEAQKKQAFKAFEERAKVQKLPKEITKLVTKETIVDHEMFGNKTIMYMDKGTVIFMIKDLNGKYSDPAVRLYDVQPEHIAEPLPPVSKILDAIKKKPYFSVPKALEAQLSDKEYFKTLSKILNSNFAVMMPLPQLNEDKISKNKYAGKLADMTLLYFGEIPSLEKGMSDTEIKLHRQLGFIMNGAVDIMKAGGKLSYSGADCGGWTYHGITLGDNRTNFVVFNGRYNKGGSLGEYRKNMVNRKGYYLRKFHENFHALMKEHGVEPGTNPKAPGLTADQRVLAGWGNALDNYIINIYFNKKKNNFSIDNQKMKSSAELLEKENTMPAKEIKTIILPGEETAKISRKTLPLARLSCEYTK